MYIRQTKTSSSKSGEHYCTYRLVASERIGGKVRQKTLLNLGAVFSLPREQWPHLCSRIEQLLSGQTTFLPLDTEIEPMAQRYAGQIIIAQRSGEQVGEESNKESDYQEVDVNSVELVRPRSIGVEHAGLSALVELNCPGFWKRPDLMAYSALLPWRVSSVVWRFPTMSLPPGAG